MLKQKLFSLIKGKSKSIDELTPSLPIERQITGTRKMSEADGLQESQSTSQSTQGNYRQDKIQDMIKLDEAMQISLVSKEETLEGGLVSKEGFEKARATVRESSGSNPDLNLERANTKYSVETRFSIGSQGKRKDQDKIKSATVETVYKARRSSNSSFATSVKSVNPDGENQEMLEIKWADSETYSVPPVCALGWTSMKMSHKIAETQLKVVYVAEALPDDSYKFQQGQKVFVTIFKKTSWKKNGADRRFMTELAVLGKFNAKRRTTIVPELLGFVSGARNPETFLQGKAKKPWPFGIITPVYPTTLRQYVDSQCLTTIDGEGTKTDYFRSILHSIHSDAILINRIAHAISELHQAGIFHHSINPDNIYVTFDTSNELTPILSGFDYAQISGVPYKLDHRRLPDIYTSPELKQWIEKRQAEKTNGVNFKNLVSSWIKLNGRDEIQGWLEKSDVYSFGLVANFIMELHDPVFEVVPELARRRATLTPPEDDDLETETLDERVPPARSRGENDEKYVKRFVPSWKTTFLRMGHLLRLKEFIEVLEGCICEDYEFRPDFVYLKQATKLAADRTRSNRFTSLTQRLKQKEMENSAKR